MRLAQGQIRLVLAGRAVGVADDDERWRRRRPDRMMTAVMNMKKFDLEGLKPAYAGQV